MYIIVFGSEGWYPNITTPLHLSEHRIELGCGGARLHMPIANRPHVNAGTKASIISGLPNHIEWLHQIVLLAGIFKLFEEISS